MSARVPRVTHKHNRRRKQTRPPVQKLAPPPICPTACACCPSRPMHARRRVATHTRPGHCAPACPSLPTLSRPPAQGGAAKRTTGRSRARGPCSHTSSRLRAPCTPGATPAGAARLEATDDALVVGPMRTAGAGSARSRLARVGGRACAWVFVRQMNEKSRFCVCLLFPPTSLWVCFEQDNRTDQGLSLTSKRLSHKGWPVDPTTQSEQRRGLIDRTKYARHTSERHQVP